tara:strand:+ start:411 stop:566 length:156 start_codon:yes stop_codon:yes gene_type:complete
MLDEIYKILFFYKQILWIRILEWIKDYYADLIIIYECIKNHLKLLKVKLIG